jgi:hypothetical protein
MKPEILYSLKNYRNPINNKIISFSSHFYCLFDTLNRNSGIILNLIYLDMILFLQIIKLNININTNPIYKDIINLNKNYK